jgi:uncharacterized protein YbjT (DUF2867 family)
MRIAVTGASGQIGSQVVRLLAGEQAHQVVALSRRVLARVPQTTPIWKLFAPHCAVRTRWCLSLATVRWRRSWFTITT